MSDEQFYIDRQGIRRLKATLDYVEGMNRTKVFTPSKYPIQSGGSDSGVLIAKLTATLSSAMTPTSPTNANATLYDIDKSTGVMTLTDPAKSILVWNDHDVNILSGKNVKVVQHAKSLLWFVIDVPSCTAVTTS